MQDSSKTVRRHATVNNGYPGKNLKFLLDFFRYIDKTPEDYGRIGKSSAQSLREQLRKDDMKISKAEEVIRTFGYKLEIQFSSRETTEPKAVVDENYIVDLPEKDNSKLNSRYKLERLSFLEEIMVENKISQRKLSEILEYSYGAVQAWLRTDDMPLSVVNLIKDKFNLKIKFKITEE